MPGWVPWLWLFSSVVSAMASRPGDPEHVGQEREQPRALSVSAEWGAGSPLALKGGGWGDQGADLWLRD